MSFPALPPPPLVVAERSLAPQVQDACAVVVLSPQATNGRAPDQRPGCPVTQQSAQLLRTPAPPQHLSLELRSDQDTAPPLRSVATWFAAQTPSRSEQRFHDKSYGEVLFQGAPAASLPAGAPLGRLAQAPTEPSQEVGESQETPGPSVPEGGEAAIEISSDRQDYDSLEDVLFAVGNVLLRFREAELTADQVQVTEKNRRVLAEGNVSLQRGQQILQGTRLEYDLQANQGLFFNVQGTISFPSSDQDLSLDTPSSAVLGNNALNVLNDPRSPQGIQQVEGAGEDIRSIRFQAARIEFTGDSWVATEIRITNDPFSPAELEIRADSATLERISDKEDLVTLKRPRLVFDQGLSVPLLRNKIRLSRERSDPFSVQIGFDDRDRGGFFLGSPFSLFDNRKFRLTVTPQIFLEQGIRDDFDFADPDQYGGLINLFTQLTPTTSFEAFAALSTLDLTNLADQLRGRLRLNQVLGERLLTLETAYRERGFNGSLGEQEVLSRTSLILNSPPLSLGNTGITMDYRVLAEYITATTDRPSLDNPADAGRFQGSLDLRRDFTLWQGSALPPTRDEGLRYTAQPIVPNLRLVPRIAGVFTGYTSGDVQTAIIGSLRLEGEFGHFSRPYLDYTSFYLGYAQVLRSGTSPFLFDRVVDEMVISGGILQQIYGPFRAGVQTSLNAETGEFFNTDILLDYSRRTYGITIRINPELDSVSFLFRVGGFNWVGNRGPLSSPEVSGVEGGSQETNDAF